MTEIITIDGKQYLIKDGSAYLIKAGETKTTEKPTEKTAINKRQVITQEEKVKKLQEMTTKQAKKWFGELDRKNPLKINAGDFWKAFKMPEGKSHYFTHKEKRLYILPRLILGEKMGKKAIVETYLKARAELENRVKDWETSSKPENSKTRAIESLKREIGEYTTLIHGLK